MSADTKLTQSRHSTNYLVKDYLNVWKKLLMCVWLISFTVSFVMLNFFTYQNHTIIVGLIKVGTIYWKNVICLQVEFTWLIILWILYKRIFRRHILFLISFHKAFAWFNMHKSHMWIVFCINIGQLYKPFKDKSTVNNSRYVNVATCIFYIDIYKLYFLKWFYKKVQYH